jgi:hypothetical protein
VVQERALLIAIAVLGIVAIVVRSRLRALRARWRMVRALRGERDGESMLARAGYRIEARQCRGALELDVDGEPHRAELRCDLIVRRGARRYVAEVKTGARAPSLDHAPTRRQLIEYQLAFHADGILLVDPGSGRVRTITIPVAHPRRSPPASQLPALALGTAIGASAGAVITWIALSS